jgi:hypothetical protein
MTTVSDAEKLCEKIGAVIDPYPLAVQMTALSTVFGILVGKHSTDPVRIRELYDLLREAVVGIVSQSDSEFQAAKNSVQGEAEEEPGQTAWNVTGPSEVN